MTKNELIEKLQSIEGNPVVKMHQSNNEPGEYIEDSNFESEIGYNTFYHDNYNVKTEECVLLTL